MSRDVPRGMAAGMARRVQLASVLLLGCVSLALAAEKVAELSDDFLEYLGSLEGDDENWTDFAAESAVASEPAKPSASAGRDSKPVASASSSSASSQTQPMPHAANANTSAASQTGKVEK
jgi:hypothetical protein